jgi:hypothetical protein
MAQPWREPFGRGCVLLEQGGLGGNVEKRLVSGPDWLRYRTQNPP